MKSLKRRIQFSVLIYMALCFIGLSTPRGMAQNGGNVSTPPSKVAMDSFNIDLSTSGIVCHISHDFISVVDLNSNQILDTIQAGSGPDWAAESPDEKNLYVTNFNSNDVSIINTKDGRKYESIHVGMHPTCICLTADGKTALISHQSQDGLWFMDVETRKITERISDGTGFLYFLKTQNKFYQPAVFRPFIHIIDPLNQKITKSVWIGGRPMSLAFTPDEKRAYIPNYDLNEVQVFDTRLDTVVKAIPDSDGRGVAVTPDGKYALVTNVASNTVTVIGIDSNAIIKVIPVDKMPTDVAVSADGKFAYITNQGAGSISVVSLAKLEVVGHIEVADNPITIFLF